MQSFVKYIVSPAFLETLVMIAIMFALLSIIKKYLIKRVAYQTYSKKDQKTSTFIGVVFNILQYIVMIVTVFVILTINGVNVTGLLAGVGIVATIVGLSLQDTLKDILSGINIYNNNFYKVNDVVRYQGELCEVKYFNARVTKFRNIYTNATYTVPNSSIGSVEKVKNNNIYPIVFPFATDNDKIMKALTEACENIGKLEGVGFAKALGCIGIIEFGVKYGILYEAPPLVNLANYPKINDFLIKALKENGVEPIDAYRYRIDSFNKKVD